MADEKRIQFLRRKVVQPAPLRLSAAGGGAARQRAAARPADRCRDHRTPDRQGSGPSQIQVRGSWLFEAEAVARRARAFRSANDKTPRTRQPAQDGVPACRRRVLGRPDFPGIRVRDGVRPDAEARRRLLHHRLVLRAQYRAASRGQRSSGENLWTGRGPELADLKRVPAADDASDAAASSSRSCCTGSTRFFPSLPTPRRARSPRRSSARSQIFTAT